MVLRHDLMMQIPSLKKKYLKYENFKDQTIQDIFTEEELKGAVKLEAYELSSGMLINDGNAKFTFKSLPVDAQFSSMYAIDIFDYDGDGIVDILLGGNLYRVKPEAGRYDASYGVFLKGAGKGEFNVMTPRSSGLAFDGEVRDFTRLHLPGKNVLLVARNNDTVLCFKTR
jgi:hypothetical protein